MQFKEYILDRHIIKYFMQKLEILKMVQKLSEILFIIL